MDAKRLDSFRDAVLTKIALGIAPEKACLLVGVPLVDVAEVLDSDEMAELIAYQDAKREEELLEVHRAAMLKAARNGVAAPVQWLLEKHDPRRFGTKIALTQETPVRRKITEKTDFSTLTDDELRSLTNVR